MARGDDSNAEVTYRAKVTGRHAITLPADLCRRLSIRTGDLVEITLRGDAAVLQAVDHPEVPDAAGLLRGYFSSWDDVNTWLERERLGWDERDRELGHQSAPSSG